MTDSRYSLTTEQSATCEQEVDVIYAKLAPVMKEVAKKLTEQACDEIHNYITDWLESDLRSNYQNMVRERANRIVQGLFGARYDESEAAKWLTGYDFEAYRRKVAENYPELIGGKVIEELTEDNKQLKEQLDVSRRRDR